MVEFVDIVNDKVADHHYKESEDLSQFTSSVTGKGPSICDVRYIWSSLNPYLLTSSDVLLVPLKYEIRFG